MDGKRRNVVELPLARVIQPMQAKIRELAKDTRNVLISDHAEERMWERDITDAEVFKALRVGTIDGVPWYEEDNEHACKVVLHQRGSRSIGVVTIILRAEKLLVKTVEWED